MSCSCAVETGLAGNHGDLVEDVRFGVKGGKMRTVILVTVEEIPRYWCPVHALQLGKVEDLGMPDILGQKILRILSDFSSRFYIYLNRTWAQQKFRSIH
jgi:hypothetical protein